MFQKLLSMKKPNKLEQLNLNESHSSHLTSDRDIAKKKDDAILTFHTITTMLSLIQSPTEVTKSGITGQKDISDPHRRDLRVLDAISALAIRKHEIAAVMAKRHNEANIQVLVSANNLELGNGTGWGNPAGFGVGVRVGTLGTWYPEYPFVTNESQM